MNRKLADRISNTSGNLGGATPDHRRLISALVGIILAILLVASLMFLSGCSTVHITRGVDGAIDANYKAFMIKMVAPSVTVDRKGVDEYTANFNAKSVGSDLEVMRDIIRMIAVPEVSQ